eukprot:TRINITY_DN1046_c0_g1_i1.p1 TRINITY_DN1046_c0_g1~~TRINITY_DN1046_c0_g1_i1.p1  ORF type:complete len:189 (-),score=42.52 TRINITY_DN1046_c0_g1_i1:261-770(-)
MLKVGDSLIGKGLKLQMARTFDDAVADGFKDTDLDEILKEKKVAIFALPGAFTGVCSKAHVPSWRDNAEALKEAGIDTIVCISVNDAFCMNAWKKNVDPENKILFLGDPIVAFGKHTGLTAEMGSAMGTRSHRYSLLIDNGVVTMLNSEKGIQDLEVSNGEYMLAALRK